MGPRPITVLESFARLKLFGSNRQNEIARLGFAPIWVRIHFPAIDPCTLGSMRLSALPNYMQVGNSLVEPIAGRLPKSMMRQTRSSGAWLQPSNFFQKGPVLFYDAFQQRTELRFRHV